MAFLIKVKRVFDPPSKEDGCRILVDRLWPRGMSKEKAMLDLWMKEVAPSHELRHWYSHEPSKWEKFQERYKKELATKQNLLDQIRQAEEDSGTVTLLFSSRELELNNATALKALLEKKSM